MTTITTIGVISVCSSSPHLIDQNWYMKPIIFMTKLKIIYLEILNSSSLYMNINCLNECQSLYIFESKQHWYIPRILSLESFIMQFLSHIRKYISDCNFLLCDVL